MKFRAKNSIETFKAVYKDRNMNDIEQIKESPGTNYEFVESIIKSRNKGKDTIEEWERTVLHNKKCTIKSQWQQLRNRILEKYREIKAGSEASRQKNFVKQLQAVMTFLKLFRVNYQLNVNLMQICHRY